MNKTISTLLQEIKAETGWSEPRIADELGTSQPTVNRILNGQPECKGSTLRAIEALHKKTCVDSLAKINGVTRRSTDKKSP
jgi:transcriptional regulator with XRE-family HTH domain